MPPVSRFTELVEFQTTLEDGLEKDVKWYQDAAGREKKRYLSHVRTVRFFGAAAGAIIVISALRLDQFVLSVFKDHLNIILDPAQTGHVLNGLGFLLGFFAFWIGRGLTERGFLRGWIRYAVAAQTLVALRKEFNDAVWSFDLAKPPNEPLTPDDYKGAAAALFEILARTRATPVVETNQWAKDAMTDLTAYLSTAADAGAISGAALTKMQQKPAD